MVALVTLVGQPIHNVLDPANLIMLYLLAIVLIARRWGQGPSTLASLLSVLAFDVFFVPPHFTLAIADVEYIISFLGFLVVGLMISTLTARARAQTQATQQHAAQMSASYELSRALALVYQVDEILQTVIDHASRTVHAEAAIFLTGPEGMALRCASPGYKPSPDQGQPMQPAAGSDSFPLRTAREVIGLLAIQRTDHAPLSPNQRQLLEAFASQAALALERADLIDQTYQMELLQARERLYTALLNSISHDLRTPLASITGVLSTLRENQSLSPEGQADLLDTAWDETRRLNRLVGNLLDMSRLEAGALTIQAEPYDVQDLVGVALAELGDRLGDHPLTVDVPADLPMVPMDLLLMVQVLGNLLDNAIKYSPPGAPLAIQVRQSPPDLEIAVADRGVGIPEGELAQVFEKFYRASRPQDAGGTGLGLSISKGIVEAHGGRIWAERRIGGGTVVKVTLPLAATPSQTVRTESGS